MKALSAVLVSLVVPLIVATPASANNTFPASGNVGIGTTSPSQALDVVGGRIRVDESDAPGRAGVLQLSNGTSTHYIFTSGSTDTTSNDLYIYTADSHNLLLQAGGSTTGYVGIGTTAPAGILDVEGGTPSSGSGTNIILGAQNGAASGNTNGGNIILIPGVSNGTGTSGVVGIGTTSPAHLLTLYGSFTGGNRDMLQITNTDSSASQNAATYLTSNDTTGLISVAGSGYTVVSGDAGGIQVETDGTSGHVDLIAGGTNGYLRFTAGGNSSTNDVMRITSSGTVGIGTTSPQAPLDVNGFMRLALNSSAPATCSSSNKGALALTHLAQVCVCDTTPAWHVLNTSTACSW